MEIRNSYHPGIACQVKGAGFLAVLTGGAAYAKRAEAEGENCALDGLGDMAVYVAIVALDADDSDYATKREAAAHWTAHSGTKLTYAESLRYFPGIPESCYRA
jgi:hypothetical protein